MRVEIVVNRKLKESGDVGYVSEEMPEVPSWLRILLLLTSSFFLKKLVTL